MIFWFEGDLRGHAYAQYAGKRKIFQKIVTIFVVAAVTWLTPLLLWSAGLRTGGSSQRLMALGAPARKRWQMANWQMANTSS